MNRQCVGAYAYAGIICVSAYALQAITLLTLRLPAPLRHKISMPKKNPNAVALGKMGGAKGGKARAAKLTPEQRSASAQKAALARWSKANKKTS